MTRVFYDHLIKIEEVVSELDSYEITIEEREEFIALIDETLNNQTLEEILNTLPLKFHNEFLSLLHKGPHRQELLEYLKEKASPDIEKKISKHAQKTKKEILKEIKKSRKK